MGVGEGPCQSRQHRGQDAVACAGADWSCRFCGKRYAGCHLLVAEIGENEMFAFPMHMV